MPRANAKSSWVPRFGAPAEADETQCQEYTDVEEWHSDHDEDKPRHHVAWADDINDEDKRRHHVAWADDVSGGDTPRDWMEQEKEQKKGRIAWKKAQVANFEGNHRHQSGDFGQLKSQVETMEKMEIGVAQSKKYEKIKKVTPPLTALLVIANTIAIGLETDIGDALDPNEVWINADFFFTFVFCTEIGVRIQLDSPLLYFRGTQLTPGRFEWDWFNLFDVTVVLFRCLDLLLAVAGTPQNLKVVTMLRLCHVGMAVRHLQRVKGLRELYLILAGVMDTTKTVMWVLAILCLFFLMLAIVMCVAIGKNRGMAGQLDYSRSEEGWDMDDYWGSVGASLMTLAQIMTRDHWMESVVGPLVRRYPPFIIIFAGFLCFSVLCCLNVITGIVVESTLNSSKSTTESAEKDMQDLCHKITDSLGVIFHEADLDGNGYLEEDELVYMMSKHRVKDRLKLAGIRDSDIKGLWKLMVDRDVGSVPIDKIIRGCSKMRGTAMASDMHLMSVDLNRQIEAAETALQDADQNNDILGNIVDAMDMVDREVLRGDGEQDPVLAYRKGHPQAQSVSKKIREWCKPVDFNETLGSWDTSNGTATNTSSILDSMQRPQRARRASLVEHSLNVQSRETPLFARRRDTFTRPTSMPKHLRGPADDEDQMGITGAMMRQSSNASVNPEFFAPSGRQGRKSIATMADRKKQFSWGAC